MGNEVYVYFFTRPDGTQFIARLAGNDPPRAGKPLDLVVDTDNLRYFDKETESAI
jgi:hypothetical protein